MFIQIEQQQQHLDELGLVTSWAENELKLAEVS
jgi:hypothetical protein